MAGLENSKSAAPSSWTATNTYYRPVHTHTPPIFSSCYYFHFLENTFLGKLSPSWKYFHLKLLGQPPILNISPFTHTQTRPDQSKIKQTRPYYTTITFLKKPLLEITWTAINTNTIIVLTQTYHFLAKTRNSFFFTFYSFKLFYSFSTVKNEVQFAKYLTRSVV